MVKKITVNLTKRHEFLGKTVKHVTNRTFILISKIKTPKHFSKQVMITILNKNAK